MVDTPGRITLWQIEIFVAAAEEASITAAASRLDASPSAVSQQLTNLENALGTKLLDRAGRPMPLTQSGEIFLRRAQSILNEAAQARSELATRDPSARIRLRLGMVEDFDADVTPSLLTGLAETLPGAQFLLETGASHRLLDFLESRALDIVVTTDPGEVPSDFEVHELMEDPYLLVTPNAMLNEDASIPSQLRKQPLIQYTSRHMMGRQIASHLNRVEMSATSRFELDSYHAIMAMVAKGEGWTILTPLGVLRAARFLDKVDLHALPFDPLSRRLALIARKGTEQDMPNDIADRLRKLLQDEIVDRCVRKLPWLAGQMRILS